MSLDSQKIRLTCPLDCPDACSLIVTLKDNRALKIEGDPSHPMTQGFACSKTYRYPERAYLESRPKYPLKRVGAKGEGRWARVSWDEALDEIAARLTSVLENHGAQSVLRYNYAGTMGRLEGSHVHAFFRTLGAIELDETICASAGGAAWEATYGSPKFGTDPEDVKHAKFIFLWGINSLATNSHLTPFLTKARKNGAKIVHVDPYQNKTSLFADEHLRVRPGTDAALALAMANVIIGKNLHDTAFIERTTRGFAEFKSRAAEWNLERASEVTGIEAAVIERLALEFAAATPGYVRVSYGMTRNESGANGLRAASILPILTGAWQHLGGGGAVSTSGAFMLNKTREGAAHLIRPGVRHVNMTQLASALTPDQKIHAMFVYNSNPVVIAPDSSRVIAGIKREDLFTVVLENAMTETADLADFVLPATTFLEHEDLYTAYGHYYLSYNKAATAPYFEARPNSWVFQELGKRLGLTEPSLYWNAEQLTRELLKSDHEFLKDITFERLEREGFIRLNIPKPFLPYANGSPMTGDGKFHLDPAPQHIQALETLTPEFPLRLLTPPAHHFLNTTYGELEKLIAAEGGEPHVKIHPEDATKYGLNDGNLVTISSKQGSVIRRAKVTEAASRGVVIVEGTWWGARAKDRLGINTLTSERLTDMGAGSTFHNTPVRLEVLRNAAD
jgi:anaerobic selenocysteine-containing dehydrogenase